MNLEQRIAEAIAEHWRRPFVERSGGVADLVRAVVAVLPTADVSDEAIAELLGWPGDADVSDKQIKDALALDQCVCADCMPNHPVRALLDAQAAAHAAEVEALRRIINDSDAVHAAEVEALRAENQRLRNGFGPMMADRDAYRARIDKVRAVIADFFTADDIRAALDGA